MLQIIKKDGVDGYESVLQELGIADNPNVRISEAVSGDNVDGYGIYEITPESVLVYAVSDGGDLMLGDGILRSVLFLGALAGIEKAEFRNGSEALAQRLAMIKSGTVLEPISDVFNGCQSCKHRDAEVGDK